MTLADKFSRSVRDKLRNRVNSLCSNPECRARTAAPNKGDDGYHVTGDAAHITAASVGGPRYDATLTPSQRKSADNGIWLCLHCARRVDHDEATYPVDLLKQWKEAAEDEADREQGRRLPRPDDGFHTTVAALTGKSPRLIHSAAHNVHRAMSEVLEQVDPRFLVSSSYVDSVTSYVIGARDKPVPLSLRLKEPHASYGAEISRALLDGEAAEIPMSALEFSGSPLLDFIAADSPDGRLQLSPNRLVATIRMSFPDASEWRFDDVIGGIAGGPRSCKFDGSACDGLFSMRLSMVFQPPTVTSTFTFHPHRWDGAEVGAVPHWEAITGLLRQFARQARIRVGVRLNGVEKSSGTSNGVSSVKPIRPMLALVEYIAAAQTISRTLDTPIKIDLAKWPEDSLFERVILTARDLRGERVLGRADLVEHPVLHLKLTRDLAGLGISAEDGRSRNFRLVLDEPPLLVFGVEVKLPPRVTSIEGAYPRVLGDQDALKAGDDADLELVFKDDTKLRISYDLGGAASGSPE